MEVFKEIDGFKGYEISTTGRVRSLKKNGEYYYFKPKRDKDGYLEVGIRNNDRKRKYRRVHRLVALSFIENNKNHPVVNHKNGIKDDNRVENLEWCTISHNTKHGFDTLGRKGNNGGMNKEVYKLDKDTLEVIGKFSSLKEASKSVGLKQSSLTGYFERVSRGVNATCGGFKWNMVEEDATTIESTSLKAWK